MLTYVKVHVLFDPSQTCLKLRLIIETSLQLYLLKCMPGQQDHTQLLFTHTQYLIIILQVVTYTDLLYCNMCIRDSNWTVLACILITYNFSSINEHYPYRASPPIYNGNSYFIS